MREIEESDIFERICELLDHMEKAIDAFAARHRDTDHPLKSGEVLSALFTLMVVTAKSSPFYDPEHFVAEFTANIVNAAAEERKLDG